MASSFNSSIIPEIVFKTRLNENKNVLKYASILTPIAADPLPHAHRKKGYRGAVFLSLLSRMTCSSRYTWFWELLREVTIER